MVPNLSKNSKGSSFYEGYFAFVLFLCLLIIINWNLQTHYKPEVRFIQNCKE